jgi:flavorubredoxin
MKIVELYMDWAKGLGKKNKILVVYDTMWGSTEKIARKIIEGISKEKIETKLFRVPISDMTEIFGELLDAKGLLIGSSTIHNSFISTVAQFLEEIRTLKPKGIKTAAFGSYGWGGGSIREIEDVIKKSGIEVVMPGLGIKHVPNSNELEAAEDFGNKFAHMI